MLPVPSYQKLKKNLQNASLWGLLCTALLILKNYVFLVIEFEERNQKKFRGEGKELNYWNFIHPWKKLYIATCKSPPPSSFLKILLIFFNSEKNLSFCWKLSKNISNKWGGGLLKMIHPPVSYSADSCFRLSFESSYLRSVNNKLN